jgi:hypothetical protein
MDPKPEDLAEFFRTVGYVLSEQSSGSEGYGMHLPLIRVGI